MAVERIASLTDENLKELGVERPRVFAKGSLLADESDDEGEPESKVESKKEKEPETKEDSEISPPLPYEIHPIFAGGNCMYDSVLQGAQRLHTISPLPKNPTTIAIDDLRTNVAKEIESNYGNYFDLLVTQLVTIIRDADYFGFKGGILSRLKRFTHSSKKVETYR